MRGLPERAVSPVVGYVMTLTVTTLLVGGLLVTAGGYLDDQRERTAESELEVVGQHVSADIAAVDRLARTNGSEAVNVSRPIPDRIVGYHYTMAVRDDGDGPTSPYLHLSADDGAATASVGIANETDVRVGSRGDGGRIEVFYDPVEDEVVLRNG